MTISKRVSWIDIAKGLGIIFVVMGHSDNPVAQKYFFWFHMPLFFIISGYLFRPQENMSELKHYIVKRTYQLLIPYLSFGIIFSLILSFKSFSLVELIKNILKLLYGGQILQGYFGVFWYITCLYLTQVIFALMLHFVKRVSIQISIICMFYLIAQIIGSFSFLNSLPIPWNLDVTFLAIVYYSFGYFGKSFLNFILRKKLTFILSVSLVLLYIYLESTLQIGFKIDMKNSVYSPMLLDVIIPLIFALCIFSISNQISLVNILPIKNIFEYLGSASLIIMYLHFPIKYVLKEYNLYNFYSFSAIGIIFPIIISHFIIKRWKWSQQLFSGIRPNLIEIKTLND